PDRKVKNRYHIFKGKIEHTTRFVQYNFNLWIYTLGFEIRSSNITCRYSFVDEWSKTCASKYVSSRHNLPFAMPKKSSWFTKVTPEFIAKRHDDLCVYLESFLN
ncbi:MAG: hypothetical protein ACKO96_35690, partial [Flammeovirgaceae bacterium]